MATKQTAKKSKNLSVVTAVPKTGPQLPHGPLGSDRLTSMRAALAAAGSGVSETRHELPDEDAPMHQRAFYTKNEIAVAIDEALEDVGEDMDITESEAKTVRLHILDRLNEE